MPDTIKVMPNQGTTDIILQACGTMEGGMQMMAANNRSISDYLAAGEIFKLAKNTNDTAVLSYLDQNGIVIGTLGNVSTEPLGLRILLKPVMQLTPATASPPSVAGYRFDLSSAPGFINHYTIPHAHYPSNNNTLWYLTEERHATHEIPAASDCPDQYMDDKLLSYVLDWFPGRGFMMAYTDLSLSPRTATFVDVMGNEAYFAPLIVLDNITQNLADYIMGDLQVELVSATSTLATLRLKRSRAMVAHSDFIEQSLTWLNDATGGTPDPLDPSNTDKTIIVLPKGIYTFGLATVCVNGAILYPPAVCTQVIEIA